MLHSQRIPVWKDELYFTKPVKKKGWQLLNYARTKRESSQSSTLNMQPRTGAKKGNTKGKAGSQVGSQRLIGNRDVSKWFSIMKHRVTRKSRSYPRKRDNMWTALQTRWATHDCHIVTKNLLYSFKRIDPTKRMEVFISLILKTYTITHLKKRNSGTAHNYSVYKISK